MGWCFDRGGLAPFFLNAPPRSSISGKANVCCWDRGKQGATAHFSKVSGIKTAFLRKSKISEIKSSRRTQHQHKQNRYSLYRSLDSSIVLKYPAIAITIKAIYKSSF